MWRRCCICVGGVKVLLSTGPSWLQTGRWWSGFHPGPALVLLALGDFLRWRNNQRGVERSPVSVYSWSAPDLQWYLTQCSIAFKIKWGLFAVFGFVFIVKIRSGSSLQVSVSGTAACSVCFVASLGTPMLLLWEQIQSVWAVPWDTLLMSC